MYFSVQIQFKVTCESEENNQLGGNAMLCQLKFAKSKLTETSNIKGNHKPRKHVFSESDASVDQSGQNSKDLRGKKCMYPHFSRVIIKSLLFRVKIIKLYCGRVWARCKYDNINFRPSKLEIMLALGTKGHLISKANFLVLI